MQVRGVLSTVEILERRAKLMGLDAKLDEELTNANYTKKVILYDEPAGGANASSA